MIKQWGLEGSLQNWSVPLLIVVLPLAPPPANRALVLCQIIQILMMLRIVSLHKFDMIRCVRDLERFLLQLRCLVICFCCSGRPNSLPLLWLCLVPVIYFEVFYDSLSPGKRYMIGCRCPVGGGWYAKTCWRITSLPLSLSVSLLFSPAELRKPTHHWCSLQVKWGMLTYIMFCL